MKRFRPNVAAILRRADGKILVGERSGLPGAWQFPQGGVHEGENPVAALHRELEEEIGVFSSSYEVLTSRTGYRYEFPPGMGKGGSWAGQEQTYFLCRYLGEGREEEFRIQGEHEEFGGLRWIEPAEFRLEWLPDFKREVYRQVFRDLLGVSLAS